MKITKGFSPGEEIIDKGRDVNEVVDELIARAYEYEHGLGREHVLAIGRYERHPRV